MITSIMLKCTCMYVFLHMHVHVHANIQSYAALWFTCYEYVEKLMVITKSNL